MEFKILSDFWRCVWWKFELPRMNQFCESPAFSFDTKELQLGLRGYWCGYRLCESWKVYYNESSHKSGLETFVYIEDKSGKLRLAYCGIIAHESNVKDNSYLMTRYELTNLYGLEDENTISMLFVFNFDSTHSKDILEACSSTTSEKVEEIKKRQGSLNLSEDINKLFNKEEHSDVILKCGDRSFFVAKNIVSARSDVFATMFRTKMSESETGVVEIEDMEPSILEQFLRFIYSGKIENLSMNSVSDLYRAGEKYAIPSLKRECVSFMVDNLSEENVCQVLLLADIFGDGELFDRAACFVLRADGFLGTDAWNDFSEQHITVAVKVYRKYHTK